MVSGKKNDLLDAKGLTIATLTSGSTKAGHKAVGLVAMPKKKV